MGGGVVGIQIIRIATPVGVLFVRVVASTAPTIARILLGRRRG